MDEDLLQAGELVAAARGQPIGGRRWPPRSRRSRCGACRRGSTLSGGETQRLKLARALQDACPGTMLVLDEPSADLHADEVGLLAAVLGELADAGASVVVADHDLGVGEPRGGRGWQGDRRRWHGERRAGRRANGHQGRGRA
ncbi:MAG: hypothetical protein HY744_09080 [Deltaproteobacteria bacterium]|nr:hypothetical protein [Deltaproteobacteria bacterium]